MPVPADPGYERVDVGVLIPVRQPAGGQKLDINTRTSLKRSHIHNIKLEKPPPQATGQHSKPLDICAFLGQLKTQLPAHRPTPSSAYKQNAPANVPGAMDLLRSITLSV